MPLLFLANIYLLCLYGCGGEVNKQGFTPTKPSAKVLETAKTVEHRKADRDEWHRTETGTMMVSNDQIRTGEASKAAMLFIDNSRTTLGPESLMVIKDIQREETAESDDVFDTAVKVMAGLALFEVKEGEKSRSFMVETPFAVIVHRGTVFQVEVAEDGSTRVVVQEDSVEVTASGSVVSVEASQATIVREGDPPTTPTFINLINEPGFKLNQREFPTPRRRRGF